jgi:hypothetical protein
MIIKSYIRVSLYQAEFVYVKGEHGLPGYKGVQGPQGPEVLQYV